MINTPQLLHILRLTPADQNILLVGRHGIGKSEILTHFYKDMGMPVVTLFLGQMADPGDLIGLPREQDGRTIFLPPFWFPKDDQPIVLFLDELNRARSEMLQAVMDLCLNRTLASRALPEGSRLIAAINEGEDYQLTELDPALLSRFNTYHFAPTAGDWLAYAEHEKLDERVVRFIEHEPRWLTEVDPRSFTRLAQAIAPLREITEHEGPFLSGIVGPAAARFLASLTGHNQLSALDVLTAFPQHEAEIRSYRIHQLSVIHEGIFRYLDENPNSDTSYFVNLLSYVQLLVANEEREALAHMANLFASGTYSSAVAALVTHCPGVYTILTNYVAQL